MSIQPPNTVCINLCEAIGYAKEDWRALNRIVEDTCAKAGIDEYQRVYIGSYVCENYFMGLPDGFHEAVGEFCWRNDVAATLVVPIFGQAFLERGEKRLDDLMERYGSVYDELVVNDVASYFNASQLYDIRIGLGRLMSKQQRDARVRELMERTEIPALSSEQKECLQDTRANGMTPLIEFDPVCAALDAMQLKQEEPDLELALHAPLCLATTGRNCGPASATEREDKKFRLGQGCTRHCLRMRQGCLTKEDVSYLKHGRAYYFTNTDCELQNVPDWRLIYAVAHETMR